MPHDEQILLAARMQTRQTPPANFLFLAASRTQLLPMSLLLSVLRWPQEAIACFATNRTTVRVA